MLAGSGWRRLRAALPRGGTLPEAVVWHRHRTLLLVLWAHVGGLIAFGLARGFPLAQCAVVLFPSALFGLGASWPGFRSTRVRPALAALGLLSTSAALVYLWNGAIEAHFHFFVMLALVSLYQDWVPYLLAVAFVLVHHGLLGAVSADHVFRHPMDSGSPWKWAVIHAVFVAAASVATIASWRYHEDARGEASQRASEQAALRRVAEAVATGGNQDQLFGLVAEEVAGLFGVEVAVVGRYDGECAQLVGTFGRTGVSVGHRLALSGDHSLALVARSGRACRLLFGEVTSTETLELAERAGVRESVAAPVTFRGRLWGGVVAATSREGVLPSDAEQRLADFAKLISLSIENAEARTELERRASSDPLTGLANHRVFHERLSAEVARARRHGRSLSLVLLDLDHFKRINDAHGHQVGDTVLVEFAARLLASAREGDFAGRLGGEEFGVLLPETDAIDALVMTDRLLSAVRGRPFAAAGTMTVSAGICDLTRAAGVEELARLADGALYWAKAHGRDVAFVYSPEVVEVLSAQERAERLARQRNLSSLRALAQAVDAKDRNTRQHSGRVADLSVRLAVALGWAIPDCARIREAGLLHDVGKIGVPDAILLKPDRLTAEEYEQVKLHAALGAQIASEVLDAEQVAWVRHHHERVDGGGYPDGLREAQLSEGALIMAVADSWDAMTGPREYRDALDIDQALDECRREAGRHFAGHVVTALERLHEVGALDQSTPAPEADGGAPRPASRSVM